MCERNERDLQDLDSDNRNNGKKKATTMVKLIRLTERYPGGEGTTSNSEGYCTILCASFEGDVAARNPSPCSLRAFKKCDSGWDTMDVTGRIVAGPVVIRVPAAHEDALRQSRDEYWHPIFLNLAPPNNFFIRR